MIDESNDDLVYQPQSRLIQLEYAVIGNVSANAWGITHLRDRIAYAYVIGLGRCRNVNGKRKNSEKGIYEYHLAAWHVLQMLTL